MGQNLVLTYFIRENPEGLHYAKELYDEGKAKSDERLLFLGSYGSAMMYYLQKNYKQAEDYINQAINSKMIVVDRMGCYNLYANILNAQGRTKEAGKNYNIALNYVDMESATTTSYVFLSYGNYLLQQNKYKEAIEIYKKGLKVADEKNNRVFTGQLYRSLSEAYARNGEWEKAYNAHIQFYDESNSILSLKQERAINELTRKYEEERYKGQLQERDLQIIKKSRSLQASLFLIVVILIVLTVIYIMYRHKNKMYYSTR